MAKGGSALGGFWDAIKSILGAISRFFGSLFQAEVNIVENIGHIVDNWEQGKQDITEGIQKVKDFKFDPKWKTRVINVPAAIKQVRALYDSLFSDFKDRIQKIVEPVHSLKLIFKAESYGSGAADAPSRLVKSAAKLDEIATMIKEIADASDEALSFVDAFDDAITSLEELDAIFLQQGKSRKRLEQFAEHSPSQRIGKLHSS